MSSGRYMAYTPSPSTTPHSPRISGLRASSAAVADQEKYLAELLAERHKLNPFVPVLPHSIRLLNQGQDRTKHGFDFLDQSAKKRSLREEFAILNWREESKRKLTRRHGKGE